MLKLDKYALNAIPALCVVALSLLSVVTAQEIVGELAKPTEVTINYGAAIAEATQGIGDLAWAVVAGVMATFARPLWAILQISLMDQLLKGSLNKAIESAREAVADKKLTVDVRNTIIADALNYAVTHGASGMIKWAGGKELVREKLTARFQEAFGKWLAKEKAARA